MNYYSATSTTTSLMRRVFSWMTLGLLATAATAHAVMVFPALARVVLTGPTPWLLLIAQLGLVIFLGWRIDRMSFGAALASFFAYSVLTGLSLSAVLFVYTYGSVVTTFLTTAGMFGAMALYASVTDADLSSMGSYLFMGLIGLIIGGVVNIFLKSTQFDFFLSAIGVIVFTLLTAYDVQRIKRLSDAAILSGRDALNVSVLGALQLYLDFINLFLYLLRFFGSRRD